MLRRAPEFGQQEVVEVVTQRAGHSQPDTLARNEPAVPACGSGPLARSAHVVINQYREARYVIKNGELRNPAGI